MALDGNALKMDLDERENNINQGDCVQLINDQNLFQVIGVDNSHEKCWVRKWPLVTNGSPVFEISTNEIVVPTT